MTNKVSYSLGMSIAQNLMKSGVKTIDIKDFSEAIMDSFTGKDFQVTPQDANETLRKYFDEIHKEEQKKVKAEGEKNKKEGEEWLKSNSSAEGVITTASGLQYKVITPGTGKQPSAHNQVKCHYEGKFINGQKFDSSYDRKAPATFGLNQVIPGWTEGLQLMKEGGKFEFYIPYSLGYGENGMPGAIPPCSTLIFTVELIEVI